MIDVNSLDYKGCFFTETVKTCNVFQWSPFLSIIVPSNYLSWLRDFSNKKEELLVQEWAATTIMWRRSEKVYLNYGRLAIKYCQNWMQFSSQQQIWKTEMYYYKIERCFEVTRVKKRVDGSQHLTSIVTKEFKKKA